MSYGRLCNLPYLVEATGIPYKTLDGWIRSKGKLPTLTTPRMRRAVLLDWDAVRPLLVAEVEARPEAITHKPVGEWPT